MVAAFLMAATTTPSVPLLNITSQRTDVPYALQFDGRPVRQAGYPERRQVDGVWTWGVGGFYHRGTDGTLVPMDAKTVAAVVSEGEGAIRQAVAKGAYFANVLQTYISTLNAGVVVNANTTYEIGSPSEAEIASALLARVAAIDEDCLECICAGLRCIRNADGSCSHCLRLGLREVRAKCTLACSDQEAKQRSALAKLDAKAHTHGLSALTSPSNFRCGFGVRHLIKTMIAAIRKVYLRTLLLALMLALGPHTSHLLFASCIASAVSHHKCDGW